MVRVRKREGSSLWGGENPKRVLHRGEGNPGPTFPAGGRERHTHHHREEKAVPRSPEKKKKD